MRLNTTAVVTVQHLCVGCCFIALQFGLDHLVVVFGSILALFISVAILVVGLRHLNAARFINLK